MTYYYIALSTRSHAFLLERRLKGEQIDCELTYLPRDILVDLCNLGVKFGEKDLGKAAEVLRRCGLPGFKVYREIIGYSSSQYIQVSI